MTKFLYERDREVDALVAHLQGADHGRWPTCKTIGVLDNDNNFLGGAVFYNWNQETGIIELSAAAVTPRWFSRLTANRIADFAFFECGCQMLLVHVRADQERVLQLLAGIGFTFTRVPRLFGRDLDGVICTLTDDDWYDGRLTYGRPVREEVA